LTYSHRKSTFVSTSTSVRFYASTSVFASWFNLIAITIIRNLLEIIICIVLTYIGLIIAIYIMVIYNFISLFIVPPNLFFFLLRFLILLVLLHSYILRIILFLLIRMCTFLFWFFKRITETWGVSIHSIFITDSNLL
jgi:hypothetical protein